MSKFFRKDSNDKRGKWSDVFRSLSLIVLLYMSFRWILFEPFVIPSGSMESTLLIQDYVVVKKWVYGFRIPFTEKWLGGPKMPSRGDIVVFKSVDGSGNFIVKRVVGLPGETISINDKGMVHINGLSFSYQELESGEDYQKYLENNGEKDYVVQYMKGIEQDPFEMKIPEGHLFMMGDNRNQSMDSRFWGSLPMDRIMGKLFMIWISCEESDSYSSFLCPINDLRKDRIFRSVD